MTKGFALLWLSETCFDVGSALMGFALGVWVFKETGSAEQFAWTVLSAAVPALLMAPFAGALADRYDRRWVIAGCDIATAVTVLAMAGLQYGQSLQIPHLFVFSGVLAILGSLRDPAYMTVLSLTVPGESLTRAGGVLSMTKSVMQVGVPMAGGYLLSAYGLAGVLAIQVCLVFAGAISVFGALSSTRSAIRYAGPPLEGGIVRATLESFGSALSFLRGNRQMATLLAYGLIQQSLLVLVTAMITPMVMSTHGSQALGLVLSVGALGSVCGAVLMIAIGVNRRLMLWVLLSDVALSASIIWAGMAVSVPVWCVCAFLAMAASGASSTCSGALWMRKLPADKLGGVFALNGAAHLLAICAVMLLGGSLVERVFEPRLLPGGAWSAGVGELVGVGLGRGFGLLFVLLGSICLLASLLALCLPTVRRLDNMVPDREIGSVPELVPTGIP